MKKGGGEKQKDGKMSCNMFAIIEATHVAFPCVNTGKFRLKNINKTNRTEFFFFEANHDYLLRPLAHQAPCKHLVKPKETLFCVLFLRPSTKKNLFFPKKCDKRRKTVCLKYRNEVSGVFRISTRNKLPLPFISRIIAKEGNWAVQCNILKYHTHTLVLGWTLNNIHAH